MITSTLINTEKFYLNPLRKGIVDKTLEQNNFVNVEEILGDNKEVKYDSSWPGEGEKYFKFLSRTFDDEIVGTMSIIEKETNKAIGIVGVLYEAPNVSDLKMVEVDINLSKDINEDINEETETKKEVLTSFINFLKTNSQFDKALIKVTTENQNMAELLNTLGFTDKGINKDRRGNEFREFIINL